MKLFIYFITVFALLFISCKPSSEYQKSTDGSITWIDIDQAAELKNNEEKLYFVDVYTEWCGWCKVMDKKTFTDPEVIKLMSEKFHMVKFDAEQTNLVNWEGQEYIYKAGGRKGIHGLAPMLLKNRLSYPSFAILDKNRKPIKTIVGYKKPDQLISEISLING
ncbi:MAG: thioredoxin-related protein [Saprospiraceae bacterium]|jgi:thioredoxin-related protein